MSHNNPISVANELLTQTPCLPHDKEGPVFSEPWEAKVFAFTIRLYEAGHFTWPAWCDALSACIKDAQANGDPDVGDTYYLHWLTALETMVAREGLATPLQLGDAFADWQQADHSRSHGEAPVYIKGAGQH